MIDTMSKDFSEISEEMDLLSCLGYGGLNIDALWKWSSILKLGKGTTGKIIEAGGGSSPIASIISLVRQIDYTNVDINFNDRWFQESDLSPNKVNLNNRAKNVQEDFLSFCKRLPDNSVDLFIDGCSIIHFNPNKKNINKGLYDSCVEIRRCLKPTGKFIIVSDCLYPDSNIQPDSNFGELLFPSRIDQCIRMSGLSSSLELTVKCEPDADLPMEIPGPQYKKLAFKEPIQGWIQAGSKRLTIFRGLYSK